MENAWRSDGLHDASGLPPSLSFGDRWKDAERGDGRVHLSRAFSHPLTSHWLYHDCSPKTVFIMGGGEGSAAREVLKHKTIHRVVMCDIDEEVVDFCRRYLTINWEAFASDKLCLVINDARAELEKREEKYDIIVGDLADPVEGGPCYQLYTKSFYEQVLKPKLHHHGIFVTQVSILKELKHLSYLYPFTSSERSLSIKHRPLSNSFSANVLAYTAHVPSFADTWGWVMVTFASLCYFGLRYCCCLTTLINLLSLMCSQGIGPADNAGRPTDR
ncbi:hypothetical protein B296_00004904 [Ensete ventricosum]|uniref:PABS domain-containing protein n=1 Tax=Ensete ventricosum TaxID=4639 RepID=A0A427BB66_ENSVE|nr:hypothetical protein B296_00004904 [Ensete ventricosum]